MSTAARVSLLAAAIAHLTVPPASNDGRAQWLLVAAQVDAMIHTDATVVNADVQDTADRVFAVVSAVLGDEALYRRFKVIAATGEFDFAAFERLLRNAPALWYARHQQRVEDEAPGAVVPEVTVERAVALRNRMARLLRYHFEDHAAEAPLVATLTGTRDRAALSNELLTAADLYARQSAVVQADRRFVAGDEAEARGLSSEIRRALGERHADGVRWSDRVAVLWGLVQRDYAELRALGQWLLRATPEAAKERLPPLVLRSAPRAKAAEDEAPAEDEQPGAEEKPANDAAPASDPAKPAEVKPAAVPAATKPRALKAQPAVKKARRAAR